MKRHILSIFIVILSCTFVLSACNGGVTANNDAVKVIITGRPTDDKIAFDTENLPVIQLGYTALGEVSGTATWETSNNLLAEIDGNGKLCVKKSGEVTIYLDFINGGDSFTLNIESDVLANGTSLAHTQSVSEFVINIPEGRDARILQLSDPQVIDVTQLRTNDRIDNQEKLVWQSVNDNCDWYIKESVRQTNPDLVLLAGDVIYGEFDDNGNMLRHLVQLMDSQKVYWGLVFGNHDNESDIGIATQLEILSKSKYCLFYPGNTDGNSNYTISLEQGGKRIKNIFMLDTNACSNNRVDSETDIIKTFGATKAQEKWFAERTEKLRQESENVSSFVFMHIPFNAFKSAVAEKYPDIASGTTNTIPANLDGDFGYIYEKDFGVWDKNNEFFDIICKSGVNGVFVGHNHMNNASILYKGIRLTFGLKTGTFDQYAKGELGGTLITLSADGSFVATHNYVVSKDTENFEHARFNGVSYVGALMDVLPIGGLDLSLSSATTDTSAVANKSLVIRKSENNTVYTGAKVVALRLEANQKYKISFNTKLISGTNAGILQLYDRDIELLATYTYTSGDFSLEYTPTKAVHLFLRFVDNVADNSYEFSLDNISVTKVGN